MAHHNSPFKADVKNGRVEGKGTYTFASTGHVYEGEFHDGEFHGKGTIHFTHGAKYEAQWDHGVAVNGKYTFKDGLEYALKNWDYCTRGDRRFYSERCNGIKPADQVQLTDFPVKSIPIGAYDVGDGYYMPSSDGMVHEYGTGRPWRAADADERKWILANCRVGLPITPAVVQGERSREQRTEIA